MKIPVSFWVVTAMLIAIAVGIVAIAMYSSARAQVALPKIGQCPSGYASSANYCIPMSGTRSVCVAKSGSCPAGYVQSGGYCCTR